MSLAGHVADVTEGDQLGLSAPHGLGIRQGGDRRRNGERRSRSRGARQRRLSDRRRQQLRGLLFTALTLAIPTSLRSVASFGSPKPSVTVSVDSFVGLPPHRAYDLIIAEASQQYGVDEDLIRSIMQAESAFDPFAVSRAGALGLMQLMPAISREFGVTNPFDPRQNIMAGTRLLSELLDMYNGNMKLAVASYNAGPTAVRKYGKRVPPFKETQNYVKKVTGLYERAQRDETE